jgi:hypothetical protein
LAVTNDQEFRAWLEGQPQEVCVAIAFRAALRVLPLVALTRSDDKRAADLALKSFRAILTSGVSAFGPTPDVKAAANAAAYATHAAAIAAAQAAAIAAANAAHAAAYAAAYAAHAAANAATHAAAHAADAAANAAYAATYAATHAAADAAANAAARADTTPPSGSLMSSAIAVPLELQAAIDAFAAGKADLLRTGGPWTFWAKWYDRAMAGDPLPWGLQEQIALIPNEVWKAGPEAVAVEIARLEAEFDLRKKIADFETRQTTAEETRTGIGGNNPPQEIDDPVVAEQVVILWDSIAGLKEEVDAGEPDAERVSGLTEGLQAVLKAIIAWFGRKGDLALDTAIKWCIPAGGGSYFLMYPAKAEAVLKAAQTWLSFLLP